MSSKRFASALALIVCVLFLSSCKKASFGDLNLDKHDFRNYDLGDSVEKVRDSEKFDLTVETEDGDATILIYDNIKLEGREAKIIYRFQDEGLISATAVFAVDDEEFHQKLKDYCIEHYKGSPTISKADFVVWIFGQKEIVLATEFDTLTLSVYHPDYTYDAVQ